MSVPNFFGHFFYLTGARLFRNLVLLPDGQKPYNKVSSNYPGFVNAKNLGLKQFDTLISGSVGACATTSDLAYSEVGTCAIAVDERKANGLQYTICFEGDTSARCTASSDAVAP